MLVHQYASSFQIADSDPEPATWDENVPEGVTRHLLGEFSALAERELRKVRSDCLEDLVVTRIGRNLFAVAENCPHADASLAECLIDGYRKVCPLNFAEFNLRDGSVHKAPKGCPRAQTFRATEENGQAWIWTPGASDLPISGPSPTPCAQVRHVSQVGLTVSDAMSGSSRRLPELDPGRVTWLTFVLVAAGLAIIYLFPYVTKAIPSPLVTIIVLTALSLTFGWGVRTVGDMGALPDTLPVFLLPDIPLTFETLQIIFPYALAVAVVGLLESLMTQTLVDDLTDTKSSRNQECIGQGLANTATGFIGGMAGCAMIGQSMINVKSGGRGRLSCAFAGVMLLIFCVALGDWVSQIPMPALVAIMIMVSIGTFSWSSIKNLRTHPRSSSIVMIATVVAVVYTHNLAIGVLLGVLLSGIFFAGKIAQLFRVTSTVSADGRVRTYRIEGQLFYGSVEDFMAAFDFKEALDRVVIDVSAAHIWDISSVQALDMAVMKFRRDGAEVEIVGMNAASETIVDRLAVHDKPGAMDKLTAH